MLLINGFETKAGEVDGMSEVTRSVLLGCVVVCVSALSLLLCCA